jgi:hypothetical protein
MEWKDDEKWSFRMSQEVGRTRPWPGVGMPTSLGFPNPGLSEWVFVAIGRVANTPTTMARVVVLLNMIGLIGFAAAVRAFVPPAERESWLWGLALQAVSPFAIRMSRKVWPPSILTPLLLVLWIGHRYRQGRWGAFAWGLAGALIGQVHLSGWFVAAGLVVGTLAAEYLGRLPRSRHWHFWLFGTVLGLIGAVPWARALLTRHSGPPGGLFDIDPIHQGLGYLYGFVMTASSLSPQFILGLGYDSPEYSIGPIIDGIPTYLSELPRLLIILAFVARIAARLIDALAPSLRWARSRLTRGAGGLRNGGVPASGEPAPPGRGGASTGFYLWTTLVIPGVLFVLTTKVYFYHYYFVLCPFVFVLVAVFLLPWRRVLLSLVIAQALSSYAFLDFVHHRRGPVRGEYGSSYAQQRDAEAVR